VHDPTLPEPKAYLIKSNLRYFTFAHDI